MALALSACGSSGSEHPATAAAGTLASVLARPGPDVALVQGTSDYAVGDVRITFLVIDPHARAIDAPRAEVWVARTLEAPPLLRTTARLEPIGVPGRSEAAGGGVTRIYVTRFRIARPGKYT